MEACSAFRFFCMFPFSYAKGILAHLKDLHDQRLRAQQYASMLYACLLQLRAQFLVAFSRVSAH